MGQLTVRSASAVPAPALALAEDVSHDAWRARGLGETCRRTYLLLAQRLRDGAGSGLTTAEAANGTDVGERQARRNLGRLAAAGLARREPDGRWSVEERDGEQLAEARGVAGRGAEQRQRHGAERLGWRLRRTLRRAASSKLSSDDRGPGPASPVVPPAPATSPTAGRFSRAAPQQNPLIVAPSQRGGRGAETTGPAVAGGAASISGIGAPVGMSAPAGRP